MSKMALVRFNRSIYRVILLHKKQQLNATPVFEVVLTINVTHAFLLVIKKSLYDDRHS